MILREREGCTISRVFVFLVYTSERASEMREVFFRFEFESHQTNQHRYKYIEQRARWAQ